MRSQLSILALAAALGWSVLNPAAIEGLSVEEGHLRFLDKDELIGPPYEVELLRMTLSAADDRVKAEVELHSPEQGLTLLQWLQAATAEPERIVAEVELKDGDGQTTVLECESIPSFELSLGLGKYGDNGVSYQGTAKAECASVSNQGKGQVGVQGEAGLGAEAQVGTGAETDGSFQTAGISIGGMALNTRGLSRAPLEVGVQANAEPKVSVGLSPPAAIIVPNAGAFAGAKAQVEGKLGVGPFSGIAAGDLSAGIGAEANAGLGYQDGKLKFSFGAGAALGLGGGIKAELEVDIDPVPSAELLEIQPGKISRDGNHLNAEPWQMTIGIVSEAVAQSLYDLFTSLQSLVVRSETKVLELEVERVEVEATDADGYGAAAVLSIFIKGIQSLDNLGE